MPAKLVRSPVWSWLGPCASFLCLIHCFGTGLIALFAPGLLKLLPHTLGAELAVFAITTSSGAFTLIKHAPVPLALRGLYIVGMLLGLAGVLTDGHNLFHGGLVALGLVPMILLVRQHQAARNAPPACCEHDHGG